MLTQAQVSEIKDAKDAVVAAENAVEVARRNLDKALARAYKSGGQVTHIANVAGLTRLTVYKRLRLQGLAE